MSKPRCMSVAKHHAERSMWPCSSLLITAAALLFGAVSFALAAPATKATAGKGANELIQLRAWGVPTSFTIGPFHDGELQVMEAFRRRYPWIDPVNSAGMTLPGGRTWEIVPFMQIAGDVAADVMYVGFRQSDAYISMKLLYPLDRYVETLAGVDLADGSALPEADYLAALSRGKGWSQIQQGVPAPCWPVMRRLCPYGAACPHRKVSGLAPLKVHNHIWFYPAGPVTTAMQFDRTLLAERATEGVELRTPRDWNELLAWAKLVTDPPNNTYGLLISAATPGWTFANFVYGAGGKIVQQNADGDWYCVLDSEAAVEAGYFWARLRFEKVMRDGKQVARGVVQTSEQGQSNEPLRYGFRFRYLDNRFYQEAEDQSQGLGPVPAGPTGLQRSEFNAIMLGVFSGLANDTKRRDAAWDYIQFYDGDEARRIRTEKFVEGGLGPYVRRELLERFNDGGRYDSVIRRIPKGLEATYKISTAGAVPEAYGRNCQYVYDEMAKPLGAIWNSSTIRDAIDRGEADVAKAEIRGYLKRATERINQKLLGVQSPAVLSRRTNVAWLVIAGVVLIFASVLRQVFKAFRPPASHRADKKNIVSGQAEGPESTKPPARTHATRWRHHRNLKAWVMLAPALSLIAIWMYWPVIKGSVIAFQDYNVLGDSQWVGAGNFATVLYSGEFWYSMRVSLYYAILFLFFGFWVPIGLALLLSEVPRGKVLFRTIYYLPAVLSGVVVIFLWKSFYRPDGMLNQVFNGGVWVLNLLPGVSLGPFNGDWLQDPRFALICCLLPTVWVGMGPGCLIYLAALKTIPEDLYEAADIDGAGIRHKLFHIALPTIRMLILINFIGAMIGAVRGSGGFALAMTGGGPYGESGGATEVVGLKIFYTTFGYLQFGVGAAMAWVLGAMLIGFTVLQLKRMSNLEFRAVKAG